MGMGQSQQGLTITGIGNLEEEISNLRSEELVGFNQAEVNRRKTQERSIWVERRAHAVTIMTRNTWLSKTECCKKHEGQNGNGIWRKAGEITKDL